MSGCCAPSPSGGRASTPTPVLPARPSTIRPGHDGTVPIPGGTFTMGDDREETLVADGEGPARNITLSPYRIDATTVSNARFAEFATTTGHVTDAERYGWSFVFVDFLDSEASRHVLDGQVPDAPWWVPVRDACWHAPEGPGSTLTAREDHPVVHVSWRDAAVYAAWAGKRLPTEAEWEHAARGGLERARLPWGDELEPNGEHGCNIWQGDFPVHDTGADGYRGTAPATAFNPNGFGLHNASGNVWEWCADWWSTTWHPLARERTRLDPVGPPSGDRKVIRGGSYLCHRSYCTRYRVAARTANTPDSTTGHTGFRCATDESR